MNKLLKKAVHVREDILAQAVDIFRVNKVEVYGAPYEADFQLVFWELSGFTDGTISVDSDIFGLGSKMFVDVLKTSSKLGNCMILKREEVMKANAFTDESSKWSDEDLLVYGALLGCDWIPRIYNLKHAKIKEFMKKWIRAKSDKERMELLKWISANCFWPKSDKEEGKGKGEKATNFPERFLQCINFMTYAPVIRPSSDGTYEIGSLNEIPVAETRTWQELIGFYPRAPFRNMNIEHCYEMRIWARTGKPLRSLPLPPDPLDSTRSLPHGSIIKFGHKLGERPVDLYPTNVLLEWLYFHGVLMPKGSTKAASIDK